MPVSDHSRTHSHIAFSVVSRAISLIVVFIGYIVLFGWHFDITVLRSLYSSFVSMKVNTALSFILSGASVYLLAEKNHGKLGKTVFWACALLLVLIGLLTLVEYLAEVNFHIDEFLYKDSVGAVGTSHPGRMAPVTALSFFIVGINLILRRLSRYNHLSQIMTLTVGFLALLAITGYVYRVEYLYGIASRTQMALHTALTFLFLCLGLLFSQTEFGLMRIMADEGIAGTLIRRFLPAVIVINFTLGWLQMRGQQTGFYDLEFERALYSISTTVVSFILIWWAGSSLKRTDDERKRIALALEKSHEELEQRIEERTSELVRVNDQLRQEMDERKQALRALSENEAKYKLLSHQFNAVLEAIPDSLSLVSTDFKIVWANMSAIKSMPDKDAYDRGGYCYSAWHSRTEPCEGCPILAPENAGQSPFGFVSVHDGRMWEFRVVPIRDDQGMVISVVRLGRDITDIRKLEAQLRQAHKLEAIGTLAGGIAHDFNNILSPIIGYTEMALGDAPGSNPMRYELEQVLTAANRAKELVKQILAFGRSGQDQLMRPIDISQVVKEALALLRASIPTTIEIKQDIERGVAVADSTQIHQIIVNLGANAAHAMEDGGRLTVSLKGIHLTGSDLTALSLIHLRPGPYLRLSVADTGHGMDAETMQRIFDPYFTSKDVGKGTGLGLAVVHGLVKRHGGEIQIRSAIGQGSCFDLYFPMVVEEPKIEAAQTQIAPKGSERILIVDDERPIAEYTAKTLKRLGYRATAHTNAQDALDFFRTHSQEFDLVITDYTMPGLTGIELAKELLKIRPDIPIVLATGFNEKATDKAAKETGIRELVLKPLEKITLANLVRRILGPSS
ncbi:MAG: response regulator [Deltaproteobacteria bacterium]|nr:response regulator [Deltaproteobacteria bacterium]